MMISLASNTISTSMLWSEHKNDVKIKEHHEMTRKSLVLKGD